MLMHRYDYLMGCASIPLTDGVAQVGAIWQSVAATHLSPPEWRVFPKTPFAALPESAPGTPTDLPPLIKGYLRLGAQVCGEPAWDPAFNVADLFLLLSLDRLSARYAQHFIRPPKIARVQSAKPSVNEASFTGQTQGQLFCNRK
jgi:putative hemolysin